MTEIKDCSKVGGLSVKACHPDPSASSWQGSPRISLSRGLVWLGTDSSLEAQNDNARRNAMEDRADLGE